jgi:hypothetical protein
VNGAVSYWDILEELRRPGVLDMRVSAEPPSKAGPNWSQQAVEFGRSLEGQCVEGSALIRLQSHNQFSSFPTVRAADCGVDQCAICIGDVGPDDSLMLLPCKHAYHPLCVARWLTQRAEPHTAQKQSCPLCCRRMVHSPEGFIAVDMTAQPPPSLSTS